jgi:peptide chain release factor 2
MEETKKRIQDIEKLMNQPGFWNDKEKAQALIKELNELKDAAEGKGKYDRGNAILSIFSGAGGDDAEDFAAMLFVMYRKYVEGKGWGLSVLHEHMNDYGGYRNVAAEIAGKDAYGTLKHETGVHRLVRISPFNASKKRHTSFVLVEFLPQLKKTPEFAVPEDELDVQFARSSGPGGQNVNKRETAVRIVHTPTNLSAHAESERSQVQNKEKALEILYGKLYRLKEEKRKKELKELSAADTKIEWGNQIRSYVLHPYKMVKDHRTSVEVHNVEAVLGGGLDAFIEAEKRLE